MKFDIFFSICQTPVRGETPSEAVMFRNFFDQVSVADELGFETAWVAEAHFSTQVQKTHKKPVVPYWQGEIGLNTDILQLAHLVFQKTKRIEVGSAIMNILCNGGPVAAAERVATFCALHGINPLERRRLHVGFSAGRFDFINRTTGLIARNDFEEIAWSVVRGKVFAEGAEIFVRLLNGECLRENDIPEHSISRSDFRSDDEWAKAQSAAGHAEESYHLPRRFAFEAVKIIPQDWRRDLLQLVIGSHEPKLQEAVNRFAPVQVFNLSITKPELIEDTHRRMNTAYHKKGGSWQRGHMPRTVFVFVNEQAGKTPEQRRSLAKKEASDALGEYWKALEGTIDPKKVNDAADNALIGNAQDIANQILERFHPEDRLMLWFDFFNHDNERIMENMRAFREKVVPLLGGRG